MGSIEQDKRIFSSNLGAQSAPALSFQLRSASSFPTLPDLPWKHSTFSVSVVIGALEVII